jgi:hypothetical protein
MRLVFNTRNQNTQTCEKQLPELHASRENYCKHGNLLWQTTTDLHVHTLSTCPRMERVATVPNYLSYGQVHTVMVNKKYI